MGSDEGVSVRRRELLTAGAAALAASCSLPRSRKSDLEAYWEWEKTQGAAWATPEEPLDRYHEKLVKDGLRKREADAAIARLRRELAREEGEFYDKIYAQGPRFNPQPNRLLVEAASLRAPGNALDVGMGQGRNALYLAKKGWQVTGFDVSRVGLEQAREQGRKLRLPLEAVLCGDEEFDFGREQWDMIAIIYALEKRSVRRAREALKQGGLLVVESGRKVGKGMPFEYETGELRRLLPGFRILKYEEVEDAADWGLDRIPLVRVIAERLE
jgi:SAM-dependent methyltransferase